MSLRGDRLGGSTICQVDCELELVFPELNGLDRPDFLRRASVTNHFQNGRPANDLAQHESDRGVVATVGCRVTEKMFC